jgi:hypothetical protein
MARILTLGKTQFKFDAAQVKVRDEHVTVTGPSARKLGARIVGDKKDGIGDIVFVVVVDGVVYEQCTLTGLPDPSPPHTVQFKYASTKRLRS